MKVISSESLKFMELNSKKKNLKITQNLLQQIKTKTEMILIKIQALCSILLNSNENGLGIGSLNLYLLLVCFEHAALVV